MKPPKQHLLACIGLALTLFPAPSWAQAGQVALDLAVPAENESGAGALINSAGQIVFQGTKEGLSGVYIAAPIYDLEPRYVLSRVVPDDAVDDYGNELGAVKSRHISDSGSVLIEATIHDTSTPSAKYGLWAAAGATPTRVFVDGPVHGIADCDTDVIGGVGAVVHNSSGWFATRTDYCGVVTGNADGARSISWFPSTSEIPVSSDLTGSALHLDAPEVQQGVPYITEQGAILTWGHVRCAVGDVDPFCGDPNAAGGPQGRGGLLRYENGAWTTEFFHEYSPVDGVGPSETFDYSPTRLRINDAEQIAAPCWVSWFENSAQKSQGGLCKLVDGHMHMFLRTSDSAPGSGVFESFAWTATEPLIFIDDAGRVAFWATLSNGGSGMFRYDGVAIEQLFLESDTAPGFDDGVTIGDVKQVTMNPSGALAFITQLKGLATLDDEAVFAQQESGKWVLVAREGDAYSDGDEEFEVLAGGGMPLQFPHGALDNPAGGHGMVFNRNGRLLFHSQTGLIAARVNEDKNDMRSGLDLSAASVSVWGENCSEFTNSLALTMTNSGDKDLVDFSIDVTFDEPVVPGDCEATDSETEAAPICQWHYDSANPTRVVGVTLTVDMIVDESLHAGEAVRYTVTTRSDPDTLPAATIEATGTHSAGSVVAEPKEAAFEHPGGCIALSVESTSAWEGGKDCVATYHVSAVLTNKSDFDTGPFAITADLGRPYEHIQCGTERAGIKDSRCRVFGGREIEIERNSSASRLRPGESITFDATLTEGYANPIPPAGTITVDAFSVDGKEQVNASTSFTAPSLQSTSECPPPSKPAESIEDDGGCAVSLSHRGRSSTLFGLMLGLLAFLARRSRRA